MTASTPLALALTITPANPNHGDKLTATYSITGEPAVAPITTHGSAVVDGVTLQVDTVTTLSNAEVFNPPTTPGITWAATADPKVFTGIAP